MLDNLRRKIALSSFRRTGWGRELQKHAKSIFEGTMLRDFSEKGKREFSEALYLQLMEIDRQADPFPAFRQQFASAGLAFANLEVLALKPEELIGMFVPPYISGQLHGRIRDAAEYDGWIASVCEKSEFRTDDAALYAAVQGQTVVNLYWVNGFNLMRAKYEPSSLKAKPDWFRPFVRSMLIWAEYQHRERLGMPQLCEDLLALQHSTFANFVRDGARSPLAAWETHYEVKHNEVS